MVKGLGFDLQKDLMKGKQRLKEIKKLMGSRKEIRRLKEIKKLMGSRKEILMH